MHYRIYENVFDTDVIDSIYDYYSMHTSQVHSTNGMHKIEKPWQLDIVQEKIKPVLEKYFDTSLENLGDNIYKHNQPYSPHVDTSIGYPCFNVLIPIKVHNDAEQKFCIFDQYVNDFSSGATWVGKWFALAKEFEHNKKRKFIHNDPIVENKTNKPIDNNFFNKYLEHNGRDAELFESLSGVAVDFKPTNLIIFDSKHIHCTGKMLCDWKIGLSLRFAGEFGKEIL